MCVMYIICVMRVCKSTCCQHELGIVRLWKAPLAVAYMASLVGRAAVQNLVGRGFELHAMPPDGRSG